MVRTGDIVLDRVEDVALVRTGVIALVRAEDAVLLRAGDMVWGVGARGRATSRRVLEERVEASESTRARGSESARAPSSRRARGLAFVSTCSRGLESTCCPRSFWTVSSDHVDASEDLRARGAGVSGRGAGRVASCV